MYPNSSAPQQNTENLGRIPENPSILRQWIKQNVRGTLPERLTTIRDALGTLRQGRGVNRRYLDCVDVFAEATNPLAVTASRRYEVQPPPIPARSIQLSELISSIWFELAECYKAFLLDAARDQDIDSDAINESRACYAAIFCLGRVLFSTYEVYRDTPKGLLLSVHQLYLYALDHQLLTLGQRSMIVDFDGTDTIIDTYKRILLLDLADPYQMPFKLVHKADDMLTRLVDFAALRSVPLNDEVKGIFLIDPSRDEAGIPQISAARLPLPDKCQLLCTLPLIARVHSHIELLVSTSADVWANSEKSSRQIEYINMLRTLVVKLGVQPVRSSPRPSTEKDCGIVVGAHQLALLVHERVPHLAMSEVDEIDALIALNALPDVDGGGGTVIAGQSTTQRWVVVDENESGMQLESESTLEEQMSVGEIVGIDQSTRDNKGWIVGVIRWIKHQDDKRGNLGVLKLGWPALPAQARRVDDHGTSLPSIFLPANPNLNRGQCLVVPKGCYRPNSRLHIQLGDQQLEVGAGELIVASPSGDCFEIDLKAVVDH